jgi:hypothetical protein
MIADMTHDPACVWVRKHRIIEGLCIVAFAFAIPCTLFRPGSAVDLSVTLMSWPKASINDCLVLLGLLAAYLVAHNEHKRLCPNDT